MSLTLLPAVDVRDGKAVRLRQGRIRFRNRLRFAVRGRPYLG